MLACPMALKSHVYFHITKGDDCIGENSEGFLDLAAAFSQSWNGSYWLTKMYFTVKQGMQIKQNSLHIVGFCPV